MPPLLQLLALLFFICGSVLYYGIRILLHKRGYPVSLFVYSGPCWGFYRDLIEKSAPPEQKRLKARKAVMTALFILAGICLVLSTMVARPQ